MKRLNYYLALLFIPFLAVTLPAVVSADTEVSGIISTDTTWTLSDSPYIVTGSVLVNSGITLAIEPGVIVKFNGNVSLQIGGTLIARGTGTDNITFTSNQPAPAAGDWGYIFFTDSSTDATYDADGDYTGGSILEYCVIEYAGGVYSGHREALLMSNAHPFINSCTIRDNAAPGISASDLTGTLKIINSTINNNTRGIRVSGGSASDLTIINSTINNNTYNGISVSGGTVTISNNIISGNGSSGVDAGGTVTISNNIISDNGSGVYAGGTVTISNNAIINNNEGGIRASGGTVTISNNTITNNTAYGYGGGIYVYYRDGGTTTISYNTISDNTSGDKGGGIYVSGDGTAIISNNTISDNTASSYGGGIYVDEITVTIFSNTITNNTTSSYGGGVYVYYNSTVTIFNNNSIAGNSAYSVPAVNYRGDDNPDFKYNTITENIATGTASTCTVSISGNPLFNYNNISNNTATYEVCNYNETGSADVNAENNWWGTADESGIQAKIYDWFDNSSMGFVDYSPFLDSPVSFPDITVGPTFHDFGTVYVGEVSSAQTFTVSNTGTADLEISEVYLTGTNPSEFSIQNDNCSGLSIIPSESCTVEVVFSPAETGVLSALVGIDIIDPDTSQPYTLYAALTGTGFLLGINNPPSVPELVYPENARTGLGTTVTFRWKGSTDPDGDPVTYDLYVCEDPDLLNNCVPVEVASLDYQGQSLFYASISDFGFRLPAGKAGISDFSFHSKRVSAKSHIDNPQSAFRNSFGYGAGLLLFGVVLAGGIRDRKKISNFKFLASASRLGRQISNKKRLWLLIAVIIVAGMLLVSCGGGDADDNGDSDTDTGNEIAYTVSGLSPDTTYYWKVVADDGYGGRTESKTKRFTTQ